MLLSHLLISLLPASITAATLTLAVPPHLPALPPSTGAILTAPGHRVRAPVTRRNTFVFRNLTAPLSSSADPSGAGTGAATTVSYLLEIACRDYDFLSYGVDVTGDGEGAVRVYRVGRGGAAAGDKVVVGDEPVEVRVLRTRDYYEARAGCMSPAPFPPPPLLLFLSVFFHEACGKGGEWKGEREVVVVGVWAIVWSGGCRLLMLGMYSLANGPAQEPYDPDRGGGVGLCVWDAVLDG